MIDIMALAATAGTVATTIGNVTKVIQGALARNQGVSREQVRALAEQLKDLSEQLDSVSEMGRTLNEYTHFLIQVLEAYAACDKLKDFVYINSEALANPDDPSHKAHWMHVETLVGHVTTAKTSNIQVVLDRIDFLDRDDATAIRMWVDQFNTNHVRILSAKDVRRPDRLIQHSEAMRDISGQMRKVFEDSVFDKMIRSLIKIKIGG